MMSLSEIVTVVSVLGIVGAGLLAALIYLIYVIRKEAAGKAVAEEKAKVNEVAVEKLTKANDIIAESRDLTDTAGRLRSGNF